MRMIDWLRDYELLFAVLGIVSVLTFLGSLFLVPLVIAHMPADYFLQVEKPYKPLTPRRLLLHLLKNILGYLFLVLGFLMLFLPGQGILTIILGVSLIDFPGKRKLQLTLLKPRRIRKAITWIRKKSGKEPFNLPNEIRSNRA